MICFRWPPLIIAVALFGAATFPALAQETGAGSVPATDRKVPALLDYIESIEVMPIGGDQPIAPIDRPLYSYSDSARRIADGGIWAWGGTGRPIAMAKAWTNSNGTRTCAFSLTSDERVVARGPQSKLWRPEQTQVKPQRLANAPGPDSQIAVRMRQLKEQARRFAAHEYWDPDNSRFELRLLVQPIHRYQDEKRQILDAAIFVMAYDNNPQILLFLEIVGQPTADARWQYLVAQVSSAELHLTLDGNEVWTQSRTPGIVGKPTDFYWHLVTAPQAP